ncbi:MAG: tetratricopeptide repeat protein [Gammaproteobacteria bacterium]
MKINRFPCKLLVSSALPALLFGCAQPQLVYQQPAPVYRPQPEPLAKQKPPAPKPKPKVKTYKLPSTPIISEDLGASNVPPAAAPEPLPATPGTGEAVPAPAPARTDAAAADKAGFTAPSVAVSGSPAVLALLTDADRNSRSGDLDAAAATVERALRIDSRNPALLYKLAQLRLKQNQPRLAEDLAKKSELYAGNNRELKKDSWLLIARARYLQGDQQGANEARAKASRY